MLRRSDIAMMRYALRWWADQVSEIDDAQETTRSNSGSGNFFETRGSDGRDSMVRIIPSQDGMNLDPQTLPIIPRECAADVEMTYGAFHVQNAG